MRTELRTYFQEKLSGTVGYAAVARDMGNLYPGEDGKERLEKYYRKKLLLVLTLLLAGSMGFVAMKAGGKGNTSLESRSLLREGINGEEKKLALEAFLTSPGEEEEKLVLEIPLKLQSSLPDKEEADLLEKQFWEELQAGILGANSSLEQVNTDLMLQTALEGYPFLVEWESSDPFLVNAYGCVAVPEQGSKEAVLSACITLGDWEWRQELSVTVTALIPAKEERLQGELSAFLQEKEQEEREEGTFLLPEEWEEYSLEWRQKTEDNSLLFLLVASGSAVAVYFLMDQDLHGEWKKKQREMKREYPFVVNKLVLYLGAGMTIRRAFNKVAMDGKKGNAVYEQMRFTCHQLQSGASEPAAYEEFGSRSGLQEYIRLGGFLAQNLRKGSSKLGELLTQESEQAFREQINTYRKLGEEASTKLLVPMVMLLALIMVMIMLPAFGSL